MTVIRWTGFAGENRAIHPRLLPYNVATTLAGVAWSIYEKRRKPV